MAKNEEAKMRCLMEAMESHANPKQAREDCGCHKNKASQNTLHSTQQPR